MPDAAPLLRAVLKHPDDDGPRLAFADWLDEHGDADRAEFVRLQCALETLPDIDDRWEAFAERERQLLALHRREWERPLREALWPSIREARRWLRATFRGVGGQWWFRRGFVDEVALPAVDFLADGPSLFTLLPVRHLLLTGAGGVLRDLATDPRLDGLASLHLTAEPARGGDVAAAVAAARRLGMIVYSLRLSSSPQKMWPVIQHNGRSRAESRSTASWTAEALFLASPRCRRVAAEARDCGCESPTRPELHRLFQSLWLDDQLAQAGVWAVLTPHPHERGPDRRFPLYALFKPQAARRPALHALRASLHFHEDLT